MDYWFRQDALLKLGKAVTVTVIGKFFKVVDINKFLTKTTQKQ